MSDKRYYWLKLNETFFEDDTIEWIEEQENGERYVLFYLKLCLKSLKDDGYLIRYVGEKLIPYDIKALSKLTNTDQDTVRVAIKVFEEIGLIESRDTGEIYMKQINEMIGSETDSAKRVRKHRAKQALLQCNTEVTKCNTEKELEKDIELEKENRYNYQELVELWNDIEEVPSIRKLSDKRRKKLKLRLDEVSVEEFKKAINKISKSNFLTGKNDRKWTADIDWLIKNDENIIKVLEGKYDNKEASSGGNTGDNSTNEKTIAEQMHEGTWEDIEYPL